MVINAFKISAGVVLLAILTFGCEGTDTVSETELPRVGAVSANVVSSFGYTDNAIGIDLPTGLQVFVYDGSGGPVADAQVNMYPNASNPELMAHQGGGRYEIDVLSGRKADVVSDYYFEVVSEWLEPERVVIRVPHEALIQRPTITSPLERSEHLRGQGLTVIWEDVPNADCYDLQTRLHDLMPWDTQLECISESSASILAESVQDFSSIRIRAHHTLGDESFGLAPYFSYSSSDTQVEVRLTD